MSSEKPPFNLDTKLIHLGRGAGEPSHGVNIPAHRASTLLLNRAEDLYKPGIPTYGLHGMDVHEAAKQALCALENAAHCTLVESGLLACTLPIFALVGSGEHVLIPDNVYGPTRRYCERSLKRLGGAVTYYSADIGAEIETLIKPETRLILMESPGSLTFELPDIGAIVDVAKRKNVLTALDNSWSGGLFLHPLDLGVDLSLVATTKYATGHADGLSGAILTNDESLYQRMTNAAADLGLCLSSDDAYLLLRGLRTMPLRLRHQQDSAFEIAKWLQSRSDVAQVLHPALPDDPYHELWKRDFSGASGLFAFYLHAEDLEHAHAFLNALKVFGMGFSYGGFESLAIHCSPQLKRTAKAVTQKGQLIRLSIGLEDVNDLISDLERGFSAIEKL